MRVSKLAPRLHLGPDFGNRAVPAETFGGCMLGWAGGNANYTCD